MKIITLPNRQTHTILKLNKEEYSKIIELGKAISKTKPSKEVKFIFVPKAKTTEQIYAQYNITTNSLTVVLEGYEQELLNQDLEAEKQLDEIYEKLNSKTKDLIEFHITAITTLLNRNQPIDETLLNFLKNTKLEREMRFGLLDHLIQSIPAYYFQQLFVLGEVNGSFQKYTRRLLAGVPKLN